MRLNKAEKEIEDLYKQGKIKLVDPDEATLLRLREAARKTPKNDRTVTIHLSDRGLWAQFPKLSRKIFSNPMRRPIHIGPISQIRPIGPM